MGCHNSPYLTHAVHLLRTHFVSRVFQRGCYPQTHTPHHCKAYLPVLVVVLVLVVVAPRSNDHGRILCTLCCHNSLYLSHAVHLLRTHFVSRVFQRGCYPQTHTPHHRKAYLPSQRSSQVPPR
jgi:hypothetical protein